MLKFATVVNVIIRFKTSDDLCIGWCYDKSYLFDWQIKSYCDGHLRWLICLPTAYVGV